jgi:hypothetical protein
MYVKTMSAHGSYLGWKSWISKNGGNWHLEGFLCYFTCLNLIFVKIIGNFQLGHHYYCLTGHMLATTYVKSLTMSETK